MVKKNRTMFSHAYIRDLIKCSLGHSCAIPYIQLIRITKKKKLFTIKTYDEIIYNTNILRSMKITTFFLLSMTR